MELDDKQLEAVVHGNSDLCVASTVGSGKTRILTYRVKHLAQSNDPSKIIAITFTQDAAKEIQERLNKLGVNIAFVGTIHALCFKILQSSVTETPYEVNEYWKSNKLKPILSKDLRVAPSYLDLILHYISHAQANMVSHDHASIHSFTIDYLTKHSQFSQSASLDFTFRVSTYTNAYKLLEKARDHQVIDFDDMVFLTWCGLQRNPQIQSEWYKRFSHVLVDEAQDNTPVQHSIVRMLGENLTLIGDVSQCVPFDEVVWTVFDPKPIEELKTNDRVLTSSGGLITTANVISKTTSVHKKILKFRTISGHSFRCSPNHVVFASPPLKKHWYVYLMYRSDLGFRIGVTRNFFINNDSDNVANNSRAQQESARKTWIIDYQVDHNMALYMESRLSLKYKIPTKTFNRRRDEIPRPLHDAIFTEFGSNGWSLLHDYEISFDLPMLTGKATRSKSVVINIVQASRSEKYCRCEVAIESSEIPKDVAVKLKMQPSKNNCYRLRRYFVSFNEANQLVEELRTQLEEVGIEVSTSSTLSLGSRFPGKVRPINASQLWPGMRVPVLNNGKVVLDEITERNEELHPDGIKCFDIEVKPNAAFFIGSGVLVHNSAYGFRSARPKEFLDFAAKAKVVNVNYNYRSHSDILEVASKLVVGKSWHLGGSIIPKAIDVNPIENQAFQVVPYENSTEESKGVVESVVRLRELNVPFSKMAVLYRTNNSLYELERAFAGSNLPYFVSKSTPFFKRKEVKDLIAYLKVVTCQDGGDNLLRILNVPARYISRVTTQALEEFARTKKLHLLDALVEFDKFTLKQKGSILQLISILKQSYEMFKGNAPTRILLEHVDRSVGYTRWLSQTHEESINHEGDINQFVQQLIYEEAPKFASPLDFLEHVKYQELISSRSRKRVNTETVTLSTIHQAKGLEWDYVFVINVNSHIIPHSLAVTPDEIDEELRLLYIAITRARRQCILSYTGYYINKGEWDIGRPSPFIPKEYLDTIGVYSEFASC